MDHLTKAEKAFNEYVDQYRKYGDKILLKINHSVRVSELCRDISEDLGLSADDIELSVICGLFHDIGRFEQWDLFRTYNDMRSVDHGDLGAEVISKGRLFTVFSGKERDTIVDVIRYHNKYLVPEMISDRNRLYVNITRDADKIDILSMYVEGKHNNLTENNILSEPVYQKLLARKPVRKEDISRKDDEIAIRLAFIFDLNFRRSFEIMKKNDYIGRMIDIQKEKISNRVLIDQLEDLKKKLNKDIEEKTAIL